MKRKSKKAAARQSGMLADTGRRQFAVWGSFLALVAASALTRSPLLFILLPLAGVLVFLVASLAASLYLVRLPYAGRSDQISGWMAFTGWLLGLHRSSYLIENAQTRRTIEGAAAGLMPGVVLVDGHSVVVTDQAAYHHRVLGPGVHFTQMSESVPVAGDGDEPARVREAIDLRRQMRSTPLQAQTRDGLFVSATLWAIFQIDRDPDPALDEHNFFRFYEQAVCAAVMAERVGNQNGDTLDWTSLPATLARDAALQSLSAYTLDELYAPRGDSAGFRPMDMRRRIGAEITEAIREPLKAKGIHLIAAGVAKIMPTDPRVTGQRVHTWRAARHRVATAQAAEAGVRVEQQLDQARSKAQISILGGMATGLKDIDAQDRRLLIALRLASALELMFARRGAAAVDASAAGNGQEG